ncbi:hypothetical protein HRbin02_00759 [Candidatus Calditenuaceae archaeon HR02]|nr:hypothetical protein HRbin02_00759 [Candidatus Calditenuaceae archaeon HR02]
MGNLRESINHFVDCVAGDKEPWPGGADAREALAVVPALLESAESEMPVAPG